MNSRIAIYCRVSTEEQAVKGLSIDAQLAALRAYAGDRAVGEYVDAGASARIAIKKRPELQRLLRDVEAGKIDLIVFVKLDRWTRNIREYYKAQDVLDAHNVAWKALQEDYETQTAAGRLKVNIMLAVAQDEADRTSERVKAVFAEKRRKGLAVNGRMPPGIDYADGKMIPNGDADKIRRIFETYIACRSINQLAARSEEFLGREYSRRSVHMLLRNEKYLTTKIVTPQMWETTQTIMEQRATRRGRTGRVYLFSGLVFCPECGYRLTVHTRTLKGQEYIYYRCDRHDRIKRCSWGGSVREKDCEAFLRRWIIPELDGYNANIDRRKERPIDAAAIQRKIDRLVDLYVSETIDREEFDRRILPLQDELRRAKLAPQRADTAKIKTALGVYDSLTMEGKKAFWSNLIRRIEPERDGEGFSFDLVLL